MQIIYGRKPVLEAINSNVEIEHIYVSYGQRGDVINKIFTSAKQNKIKISQISPSKFNQLVKNKNSQGVCALITEYHYKSLQEIISISLKSRYPLILIIDSVQDPHNLGAILRTAECAAVDGVLITSNNTAPINDTVQKASAGAVTHLNIAKIGNLNNTIQRLKDFNFWIAGTYISEKSKNYTDIDFKIPLALIVGNEEKGIRKLTADNCDILVKIPMYGNISSLNVSVAAGVILFEIIRQRNY
ncbi:23S rRNA (guanosine(2251)-2'-O)-methyltransferase RlmB [Melioribacteraceae bacterium 4301-Me]|uniref:23S rRNA (guanosine(2251)-2'-O)-methyltransferase RlmB n=1 Tax=Pyranulibacter aquaticus TaxID=3163344 RepID=UPI003597FAC3